MAEDHQTLDDRRAEPVRDPDHRPRADAESPGDDWNVGRRGFLKASLMGAAASVAVPQIARGRDAASGSDSSDCRSGQCNPPEAPSPPDFAPIDAQTAIETWNEPWVWRPSEWPGQQLDLHVVENQNQGIVVGLGNPSSVIFSYGGNTPGPTIRMRGDETLLVKLRNLLPQDFGRTVVGPNPDPATLPPELNEEVAALTKKYQKQGLGPTDAKEKALEEVLGVVFRDDFCLGEHVNGLHAAHVTNLHTHGLHVRPDRNPDGTHSDNVILRVMSQQDLVRREENALTPSCRFLKKPDQIYFLRDDEQAGEADYEFRLGDVMGRADQPHPPGTHWYHPHSHGATHNQVSSGMAGFLIVEGDVDDEINQAMTGEKGPDLTQKNGAYDYRERLVFMQRVFPGNVSDDPDARPGAQQLRKTSPLPLVNGSNEVPVLKMRPGAVERWRVINGSVDGRGFRRVMVTEGQYEVITVDEPDGSAVTNLYRVESDGSTRPAEYPEIVAGKQQLYQLAIDGITLVEVGPDGEPRYTIKDLAQQNAAGAGENPVAQPIPPGVNPNRAKLDQFQEVFRDGTTIKNTWVQPNEYYMGPANRTDLFFQAPTTPGVYTLLAKSVIVHGENAQANLQNAVACGYDTPIFGPVDIVLGHVVVEGDAVPDFDVLSLRDVLPPVPPYLRPVDDDELEVTPEEVKARKVPEGSLRTRTVTYSGWGSADYPLVKVPDAFAREHPELERKTYAPVGDGEERRNVLMAAAIRSMAIDGRKFDPNDPERPRVYVIVDPETEKRHSAEEWALYNLSGFTFGNTKPQDCGGTSDDPRDPDFRQPGYQYNAHYTSYPLERKEGQDLFEENHDFRIVTKGVDHPFHIHQNPFWVLRIEIPDEDGELHNILDEPRWMDTIWIPRNRGRVIFRARFPDFVGLWVNHCHILQHEDNGMMQPVQGTPFAGEANYVARPRASRPGDSAADLDRLYDRPDRKEAWKENVRFVDPNPSGYQDYPGFEVEPPELPG